MTISEVEKIFKKPGEKRYQYFVKKVADTEEVFGLGDEEGWAMLGDDDDKDVLPFFPDPELAEAFRKAADFDEYSVMVLDVHELLEWLDDMEKNDVLVGVCPNTEFNGAVVEPGMLREDLLEELSKYDEDGKKIK